MCVCRLTSYIFYLLLAGQTRVIGFDYLLLFTIIYLYTPFFIICFLFTTTIYYYPTAVTLAGLGLGLRQDYARTANSCYLLLLSAIFVMRQDCARTAPGWGWAGLARLARVIGSDCYLLLFIVIYCPGLRQDANQE